MNPIWRLLVPCLDVIAVRDDGVMVTINDQQVLDLLETLLVNRKAEDRAVSLLADQLDRRYRLLRELDEKTELRKRLASAKYQHLVRQCQRCPRKTRLPLIKIKSGKSVILEVCGPCYQEILKGGPLRKPPSGA